MNLTESWEQYHITTPPMPNTVDPATVTFHIAFDTGEFYVDDVLFYEGEFVLGTPSAVKSEDKLASTWGQIRAK